MTTIKAGTKYRESSATFWVLSTAHVVNDMYANFLQQFIPFLVAGKLLSVSSGATLVAAFTITSSLLQPVFGFLVDQKGQRWLLYIGTLWMAALLSMTGLIPYYSVLLPLSALAGMGTAAFHPQAAGMIGHIGSSRKGVLLASFTSAGSVGMALSPIVFMPLIYHFGIDSTWIIIIPGIITSLFLYYFAPRVRADKRASSDMSQVFSTLKKAFNDLSKLMVVVAIRSMVNTGMMTLLPIYFITHKLQPGTTSYIMSLTLAFGAIGGIAGGYISDRYGRKKLIIGSLLFASPLLLGFVTTSGLISYVLLLLGSAFLMGSFSVTVAATQEVVPENKALASGLSMGFSVGIGGLAVASFGRFADAYGIESAMLLMFALPILGALFAFTIKETSKKDSTAEKVLYKNIR